VFAKFTDLLVVVLLGLLLRGGVGSLLGFFYSLIADALPVRGMQGQSIGKRLMRIRVVDEIGNPPRLKVIPVWGWILSFLVGVPFGLIELSLIARAKGHQRLGDVMAETHVIRE
jgi:uncharacterized RDD family membrane protein YckC